MTSPSFADDHINHPADLLDNACAVVCFLGEVAGCFNEEGLDSLGLSARGCHGLTIILHGIENTIKQAAEKL